MRTSGTVMMAPSSSGSFTWRARQDVGERMAHEFADAELALGGT